MSGFNLPSSHKRADAAKSVMGLACLSNDHYNNLEIRRAGCLAAPREPMSQLDHNSTPGRVLLIVPAYNEARNIPDVLADIAEHAPFADIVIIDDASTDGTSHVARGNGVTALTLPCNLGVGGAMQTGYLYAHQCGYDVTIQFDGDGQHRADQIPALLDGLAQGADLVIGSRLLGRRSYRFSLLRWIGTRMLKGALAALNGVRVSDPTSGFRGASKRMTAFFAKNYPQCYLGDTVEAVAMAARHGMVVREVPTRMRMTTASSISSLRGFGHTLRTCLALMVDRLKRPLPTEPDAPGERKDGDACKP